MFKVQGYRCACKKECNVQVRKVGNQPQVTDIGLEKLVRCAGWRPNRISHYVK